MMDSEKLQQMQFLQQNLQAIFMQRQAFQMELGETISTLEEIEKTVEDPYKLLGRILVKMPKEEIKKELVKKREVLETRLKNLEKDEKKLEAEAKGIRDEIIKEQSADKK